MAKFDELFNEWAPIYDQTVSDSSGQYREVFEGYDDLMGLICQEIREQKMGLTLEIGVGTGNLTKELLHQGFSVIGIEPSTEMRKVAKEKLPNVAILDGHFLSIPIMETFNSIVTSYAFHHLTYQEKKEALRYLDSFLKVGGKILIADTMYESKEYKANLLNYVEDSKAFDLLNDLNTEYYEYLEDILTIFKELNYTYDTKKINKYVWVVSAQKQE